LGAFLKHCKLIDQGSLFLKQVPYGDGWDIGGSQPFGRTRDEPATGCSGGVYCRRDTIHRSWLVHLGSDPILGRGFAEFRRITEA
jgi:hypothetical protein